MLKLELSIQFFAGRMLWKYYGFAVSSTLKKKKCPDTFRITVFLPLIPLLFEKLKTLSKIKSDVVKSFYLNFLSGLVI